MGIKRIIDTAFWTDRKVEEFSPEDRYFMLYLLTNPATTQLGIYEISFKRAEYETGYSVDTVKVLIERFANKYGLILFSQETNEIAIKNFLRHSIVKGGLPVKECLRKDIRNVKDKSLVTKVFQHIKDFDNLNKTVAEIIAEYFSENENEKENENDNDNVNGNENDNDNDVSLPRYGHDSCTNRKTTKKQTNSQQIVENSVENPDDVVKHFSGNVYLSENQVGALIDEMGIIVFDIYVDRLDKFITEKNANISDHAAMILKWYREDLPR